MFICHKCNKCSSKREKPVQVLVEKRTKTYKYRDGEGYAKESHGWEIVKEVYLCQKCGGNKGNEDSKKIGFEH